MSRKVKTKSAAKPKAPPKSKASPKPRASKKKAATKETSGDEDEDEDEDDGRRTSGWTTDAEFKLLKARIPEYLEQQKTGVVKPFLIEVAAALVKESPSRTEESKNREGWIQVSAFFSSSPAVLLTLFFTENSGLVRKPHS